MQVLFCNQIQESEVTGLSEATVFRKENAMQIQENFQQIQNSTKSQSNKMLRKLKCANNMKRADLLNS